MSMKILISLRIKNHILDVKEQKFDLLIGFVCVDNVINNESAPSFAKTTLLFFQLKSAC